MTPVGMMIFAGIAFALVWAMVRKPQAITYTLAAFFLATVPVDFLVPPGRIVPILAFADAAMVAAMAALWTKHNSQRARFVGFIGLFKVALAMWSYSFSHVNFYSYATVLNTAFVGQVLVAGGFLDAVGHWIDDLPRFVRNCVLGLPGHVGGR